MIHEVESRVICFPGPYELTYETDRLLAGPDDIVMQTRYSLISPGTELALYTGTHVGLTDPNNSFARYPFYPGYASVGRVIGPELSREELNEGDRVFMMGTHSEYYRAAWNARETSPIIKLSEAVTDEQAVFASLAAVSATALLQAQLRIGDHVVVLGLGLVGNLAAQLFKIAGAQVSAVDVAEPRVVLADQVGVSGASIADTEEEVRSELNEVEGELPPDIVVEATGDPGMINAAMGVAKNCGQVILLGSPRGNVDLNAYEDIHRKGISVTGAHAVVHGTGNRPSKLSITKYCMGLIESNALKVDPLLTHTLPMGRAKEGYEMLLSKDKRALGVALTWQ